MPITRRACAVLVGALLSLTAVPLASAKVASPVFFQTPSRGIGCVYQPGKHAFLRCDVAHVEHPAKRPAKCKLDYGSAFGLNTRGHAHRLCVGDTVFTTKASILGYGHSRRLGAFRCTSRRTSLRCSNRSHHGFTLSRAHQHLF